MAAPQFEVVQKTMQNPHASAPLFFPIIVLRNTPDEEIERNVRHNSALDLSWLAAKEAHDGVAVLVGGGPSVAENVDQIAAMQRAGATVFAMNGAARWLRQNDVLPDFQVLADAKEETATLVDPGARAHLFASQVNPVTMLSAPQPTVWHLGEDCERYFPSARLARGGYVLLGGGASTGNSALCVAYAMGFRELHVFGYDSSHRDGQSHAYRQPMNDLIPTVEVEWAGRQFTSSVAMKAQAEKFQITAQALKQVGCAITVYGDGLLQHMFTSPPENLSERDKYRTMWRLDTYREVSPGELTIDLFLEVAKPNGLILDFGCGTGRASLALHNAGHEVLLIDFADNCRDHEALLLPFLEWDLCRPIPARAKFGFCADVMEHIPPADMHKVLANILISAERVFFRIDTEDDVCGAIAGQTLHLNVQSHAAWREALSQHGTLLFEHEQPGVSFFYVESKLERN